MKTLNKVEIIPVFNDFCPSDEDMMPNHIYISEKYKSANHLCLCGCGNLVILPIYNDGWKLIKEGNGKVSFTPSVGNYQIKCKSHYIITNNVANFV